ncbi:FecR family protein [Sungkyunkwania multivorans]|uniref:FecR family protein n=1 Tax=Sungkyunkwania multivorans TaxID=1173618 RepID=A0ABW3CW47_9FLAO
MNQDLLKKYFQKKATFSEKEEVLEWVRLSKENQEEYHLLKAQYVADHLNSVKDASSHASLIRFQTSMGSAYKKYIPYAAAIILVATGIFFLVQRPLDTISPTEKEPHRKTITYYKQTAGKKVTLPDGSSVLLNVDSHIEFAPTFKKDIREVKLVGEALFDIIHDASRPFVVKTKDFNVKVLGTSFNVKCYPNDVQTETTLITGKVELLREEETPIILAPSQKAVYHKTQNRIAVEEVISEDVIAWKNGTLIFNNTPMQQVVLDLERKYNVKIIINSPNLLKYEYTGTFDNLELEEALQLLMISSPINYTKENQKIIFDMND